MPVFEPGPNQDREIQEWRDKCERDYLSRYPQHRPRPEPKKWVRIATIASLVSACGFAISLVCTIIGLIVG